MTSPLTPPRVPPPTSSPFDLIHPETLAQLIEAILASTSPSYRRRFAFELALRMCSNCGALHADRDIPCQCRNDG